MMKYAKLASSEYAKLKVGKVRTFSDTVKPTLLRLRFSFLAWSQYDEHGEDDEADLYLMTSPPWRWRVTLSALRDMSEPAK